MTVILQLWHLQPLRFSLYYTQLVRQKDWYCNNIGYGELKVTLYAIEYAAPGSGWSHALDCATVHRCCLRCQRKLQSNDETASTWYSLPYIALAHRRRSWQWATDSGRRHEMAQVGCRTFYWPPLNFGVSIISFWLHQQSRLRRIDRTVRVPAALTAGEC